MRIYNPYENESTAILTFAKELTSAAICDVAEFEKTPVEFNGCTVNVKLKTREMKTVIVEF